MSNFIDHAKREFLLLGYKPIEECEDDPNKWIQEGILELLDVFAKQGHSGGSASYTVSMFKRLAMFELLSPLICDESEWNDVSEYSGREMYQNNRLSTVFKNSKDGQPYYLDAITYRDANGSCWSGTALLESGESIGCAHYIKLPFIPKTFFIDVRMVEVNKDDWESYIIDPKQLDAVFEYYDKKVI